MILITLIHLINTKYFMIEQNKLLFNNKNFDLLKIKIFFYLNGHYNNAFIFKIIISVQSNN